MKKHHSLVSIAFILIFILSIFSCFRLWKKNRIVVDAPSYYTYLPAALIYQDLHLNFIDANPLFFRDKIWYYKIEGGKKLIKHPVGLSVALAPFFMAGHLATKLTGGAQDGYSFCYQNAVSLGVIIYLLVGLFYLRKLLLNWFDDKIIALTIVALSIGTNLLWYSTFEGLMPHAISFSLLCACLFHFYEWLKIGSNKHLLIFGAVLGLSVLIRPLALTLLIYFFIILLLSKGGIRATIEFLKPQLSYLIFAMLICMSIGSLQLMYWKFATGRWLYDVYIDEHFIFDSPQMIPFLFSFRKGVFIYTPVLIFAVIGLIILFKKNRAVFYGTIIMMITTVFLLSSWWAWSYGISWGIRPMIDYYSILSIPLAAGFSFVLKKGKALKIVSSVVIFLFIALNLFQTWQYKNGAIHYDDMTREAYFKGFFQSKPSTEWRDLLSPYDWDRRIKGLPQIEYSQNYITGSLGKKAIYLRASNMKYLAANPRAQNTVAAFADVYTPSVCDLSAKVLPNGKIALMTNDGRFLSVSKQFDNALMAIGDSAGVYEQFELNFPEEDNNRITLRSVATGKYLSIDPAVHDIVFASSNSIGSKEIFRLFVVEP
ncbi:MAG: hypothetical protein K0Q95_1141 [Bacteroidota bacterium]|jgi:hypothetical protein|nr:hypothetical protein [Bacteroidota bacterium]